MKRDTRAAYRRRAADTERLVDEAVAEVKAGRDAQFAAAKQAAAVDRAREGTYTSTDLQGAVAVRTVTGWHPVVRVNRETVTVGTGFSWTVRVPVERVRDWR